VEIFTPKINKQLNIFTEGTFFGELSLILGIPRTASVKALETTILFVIHHRQFEKLLHEYPELAEVIIQELPKYQEELVERKKQLQEMNILDDDSDDNVGIWVRKRLQKIFSLSF
jgi:CRP-like cAMP-binding protein